MIKWCKILMVFSFVLMMSCRKEEILPVEPIKPKVDIFTLEQSKVTDGEEIMFNLPLDGVYTVKLIDKTTNQVLSKERFAGKKGTNNLKIYTKSLPVQYLYLTVEDMDKNQIGKTTITTN